MCLAKISRGPLKIRCARLAVDLRRRDEDCAVDFGQHASQVFHDGDVLVRGARRCVDDQDVAVHPRHVG